MTELWRRTPYNRETGEGASYDPRGAGGWELLSSSALLIEDGEEAAIGRAFSAMRAWDDGNDFTNRELLNLAVIGLRAAVGEQPEGRDDD